MLRVSRIVLPDRKFTAEEVQEAFRASDFGEIRVPGRKQIMDAHELRGMFHTYLFMVGGVVEGPESDVLEVPEHVRPFVEALRAVHARLSGGDGFMVEP